MKVFRRDGSDAAGGGRIVACPNIILTIWTHNSLNVKPHKAKECRDNGTKYNGLLLLFLFTSNEKGQGKGR
jgi:hypothetical protein